MARELYDEISRGYATARRPDARVAAQVLAALDGARTVVNVGAGTGNYEPADCTVLAVEPARAMIRQRPPGAVPAVRARAEHLPLADGAVDAALATFTVHHWADPEAGLAELRRVARRQVVLTFEASVSAAFWAYDYFPESRDVPSERDAPDVDRIGRALDVRRIEVVPVPADCTDGFAAAYWARPEAYLDPAVQEGISSLARLPADARDRGTERLRAALVDGSWERRYGHLRRHATLDAGYRLVVAGDG